jgi:release factor H-coupled RctB family protein
MGNFAPVNASARVHLFASSNAWIEDAAIRQLEHLANRKGVVAVAAMPDLHPGHHGPVGCAARTQGVVHPDVIGTDIGCGMQLWTVDMLERKLNLDKLEQRLPALEGAWAGDGEAELAARGLAGTGFASSLGTIGGGNHFCEVQAVETIVDADVAAQHGLVRGGTTLLVHSGSRGLGAHVLRTHAPADETGLALGAEASAYLADHDVAVRYATLNREVIARRAFSAMRADGAMIADVPHNMIEVTDNQVLHRKGAAAADRGLVPIAGSRGAFTYLVEPLPARDDALVSLAHGAGRKHDRGSMAARIRAKAGAVQKLSRTALGGRVICTDKRLLMEEAPQAYKNIDEVIADLEAAKLARVVAVLRPVITFKTARDAARGFGER